MIVLYPGFLWAAGLVSAGVVGLHFLTTSQPRREVFPPVRFVPEAPLHSTALAVKFSDLWLLFLRVLAIVLIGAAFAQPRLAFMRQSAARIVAVDISGTVARTPAWREQIKQATAGAATVILFDTMAREVAASSAQLESSPAPPTTATSPSKLSVALIAALRAAARLRDSADTIDLTIMAPFLAASFDAATPEIRALWPGRIGLIKSEVLRPGATPYTVQVEWADSAQSKLWARRTSTDTVTGVYSQAATLIAPFERKWRLDAVRDARITVIARWLDGEPAAVEQDIDGVRRRSIGFALPQDGDATLRPEFVRFTEWLNSPGAASLALRPADPEALAALAGTGPVSMASAHPRADDMPPLAAWLLAVGLGLVLFEPFARRRVRRALNASVDGLGDTTAVSNA
jgi:hypothetical protein